jgi:hypothetical protein
MLGGGYGTKRIYRLVVSMVEFEFCFFEVYGNGISRHDMELRTISRSPFAFVLADLTFIRLY